MKPDPIAQFDAFMEKSTKRQQAVMINNVTMILTHKMYGKVPQGVTVDVIHLSSKKLQLDSEIGILELLIKTAEETKAPFEVAAAMLALKLIDESTKTEERLKNVLQLMEPTEKEPVQ